MRQAKGLYVSPTEFVAFGETNTNIRTLSTQLATRSRRPDFAALGMMLPNPDPVLKATGRDIQVYRELRTEPQVGGNIRRRKGAVKALEYGIDKGVAKSRPAALIRSVFDDLDLERIVSEILDATLYGYQPMEVVWGKVGGYIVPVDVIGKPAEWFHFDQENRLRLKTKEAPREGELLPACKFLLPRQDASYDNPYGFPDLSMIFWPTTFKKGGLTFWVRFSEKYGSPWVIGKHPRSTPVHETDEFLEQLDEMIQDAVAVIPDDSSVQIVEAAGKGGSADVFERLLMFCRSETNIALLGTNQSTESSSNKASAVSGLEVARDIRDADKKLVESTLNQLIRWTHELNFNDGAKPRFEMWEQREVDEVLAKRDKTLTEAGVTFSRAYFMRAYDLQEGDLVDKAPAADAKTVEFAEGDGEEYPDQIALDNALDRLTGDGLNAQAQDLLRPVIQLIGEADDYPEAMEQLAALYPKMDTAALEETLTRALFVAELWGYANGDD